MNSNESLVRPDLPPLVEKDLTEEALEIFGLIMGPIIFLFICVTCYCRCQRRKRKDLEKQERKQQYE